MCLSCICLLAMHTLICVTVSLPPGISGWLRLLLVALPGLFCLPFFQYLGIDRIIGGQAISKLLLSRPLLGGCSYAYACVRETVCMCVSVPILPAAPTHTPVQCAARHTMVQARKNVIDNVHVQYYMAADTEKTYRCLELATAIIKINYKLIKINLPATGNTSPPYLEPHKI